MPIGDLRNKVSSSDVEKIKSKRNPPEYEMGFEPSDDDDEEISFSDLFDDIESDSGSPSESPRPKSALEIAGLEPPQPASHPGGSLGGSLGSSIGGPVGGPPAIRFGTPSGGFGSSIGGFGPPRPFGLGQPGSPVGSHPGGFGSPFGSSSSFGGAQQDKQDAMDKALDSAGDAIVSLGKLFVNAVKSVGSRTADDWGLYCRNIVFTSLGLSAVAMIIWFIGIASGIEAFSFWRLPFQLIVTSLLSLGTGLIGLGSAAFALLTQDDPSKVTIQQLDDVVDERGNTVASYEEDLDAALDDLLDGIEDDSEELEKFDEEFEETSDDEEQQEEIFESNIEREIDFAKNLENVPENVPVLSRELLFTTFKPFFPQNTPGFSKRRVIDPDSDEFATLETICLKALAAANKCELEEINSSLESAVETYFCYELRIKRVRGLNKLEDIEREITAYFRESSDDISVSSTVDLEGDFYKVVVNKGVNAIVTFGDIFTLKEVVDFYLNPKNVLPVVAGITESGKPVLVDAKHYNTILIAGKPRSGKSWYVLSIIMSLMMFNTPEDVVFLLIDPKESTLFKTLALMPHVCGLHNDENILQVLRDVIECEGARRKKLLADHKCDDIWDLRKRKGIKLPVLYIVIDEVMTVVSNLGDKSKEFFELMKVIISQLPSTGIRLIFVPHRAQGVVDKTIRSLIDYVAAVRADAEVVKETLDIKKWDRHLINQGDTAIRLQGYGRGMFVKGAALTTSDSDNMEFITNIARSFYKMGVEIPDMRSLGSGYNRDEDSIREELELGSTTYRVQYADFNVDDDEELPLE